jgi:hypothetical protein
MKYKNVAAVAAALLLASAAQASTTLSFEDLDPSPASFDVVPSPYNGLTFVGWMYGPDTLYTPGSGTVDLFTDYANPSDPSAYVVTDAGNAVTNATAFVFAGATFSGYSGVTFELFRAGSLVHTSASLPDAADTPYIPTFLASGYGGLVDTVVVSGVQGYYAMDDFSFTPSVPEPATYFLMLAGVCVVVRLPKRKMAV